MAVDEAGVSPSAEAVLDLLRQLPAEQRLQVIAAALPEAAAELVQRPGRVHRPERGAAAPEEQLSPEDVAALEEADAGIAAGRVVPHEIVVQGRAAVEAYLRRRNAGDVDPETLAAVAAFRRLVAAEHDSPPADA